MRNFIFIINCIIFCSPSHASGTIDFEDLSILINQHPWAKQVLEEFGVVGSGMAETRVGSFHKHLGGRRIGPYVFKAKIKGKTETTDVKLIICTRATYLGESGEQVDLLGAVSVNEMIESIIIKEADSEQKLPYCGESNLP